MRLVERFDRHLEFLRPKDGANFVGKEPICPVDSDIDLDCQRWSPPAQRPAPRLCLAVARGGAYVFGGGGDGSRTGSGLILARIAFSVLIRCEMK
jgi:hypothetical protein